jgi:hypothetical protein
VDSLLIYLRTELIKTHPRVAVGKRSTDPNDYPQHMRGYAMAGCGNRQDSADVSGYFGSSIMGQFGRRVGSAAEG